MGSMVNGGVVNGSGRGQGVHFKEMLALLVLITKGTEEEKHKCEWMDGVSFIYFCRDVYGATGFLLLFVFFILLVTT